MRKSFSYQTKYIEQFKQKLLYWSNKFEHAIFLNSNGFSDKNNYNTYNSLFAVGCKQSLISNNNSFEKLKELYENNKDWIFGYFSYDLKNETEDLHSNNFDKIKASNLHFFIPEYVFILTKEFVTIEHYSNNIEKIISDIENIEINMCVESKINIKNRFDKNEYIETVKKLKQHIQRGDIYEINLCMEYYSKNVDIEPLNIYSKLNTISPAPFSCYMKMDDIYLMSSSPERYLKKIGNKIISQPIKGTIKRGNSSNEDEKLKSQLLKDIKERSENVMIVDLVRNDLSITATKKSVKVEELFGIYSFKQVHQMISTVVSELSPKHHFIDAIKYSFPMGSMTGAPKIRAMEIIEEHEKTKRGIYSGSIGYITPNGNFDFNVIIRSILYNSSDKYLSFTAGGAITSKSVPEKEFEECELKAKALKEAIS